MSLTLTIVLLTVGICGIIILPFIASHLKWKDAEKQARKEEIPEETKVTNLTRDEKKEVK